MATKYQLDAVRSKIVSCIEAEWATSLDEWDRAEDLFLAMRNESESRHRGLRCTFPEPATAISLARKFGIDKILPAAFYELSRRPICNNTTYIFSDDGEQARGDVLSREDYQLLNDFREYLHGIIDGLFALKAWRDCSNEVCRKEKRLLEKDLKLRALEHRDLLDMTRLAMVESRSTVCEDCMHAVFERMHDVREETWAVLV